MSLLGRSVGVTPQCDSASGINLEAPCGDAPPIGAYMPAAGATGEKRFGFFRGWGGPQEPPGLRLFRYPPRRASKKLKFNKTAGGLSLAAVWILPPPARGRRMPPEVPLPSTCLAASLRFADMRPTACACNLRQNGLCANERDYESEGRAFESFRARQLFQ